MQRVRANKWCKFERTFSNPKSEVRYIREIIYGKRRTITYWEITTNPETMHENSTSFIMTNLQGNLKKTLGDLSGWKNTLNTLRLILQPVLLFWLIYPWLDIFTNSDLFRGFNHLIITMNQFKPFYASG